MSMAGTFKSQKQKSKGGERGPAQVVDGLPKIGILDITNTISGTLVESEIVELCRMNRRTQSRLHAQQANHCIKEDDESSACATQQANVAHPLLARTDSYMKMAGIEW